ncbi:MAG: stage V sporulation protein B [Candidatus Paraimprobicoccus trichonymphae]|uniref:Stage V sporulation protein B n=1 Tax=Candidatus Paraimprobicoccus trichonymphae TaxID=3033793 RepID=A0AA48HZ49_9FIRM|nr:MAG: stage V sporulation protein B [Candidatus Paraimprobicoccus trichonymphae]
MSKENKIQEKEISQSFAKSAFIMTISIFIVKILGALYKIPLLSVLGGEGYGYYGSAYNLYNPIYALSTAGLPIAFSRIISAEIVKKNFKNVKKLYKLSIPIFLITGISGILLMIAGAFTFSLVAKSPMVIYSILALAPTTLFCCLMSIYRGYYEGLRNMTPTAVSEIVESVGKVVFGLGFAFLIIKYGNQVLNLLGMSFQTKELENGAITALASSGAVLGITVSSAVGFIYLVIKYKRLGDGINQSDLDSSPKPESSKKLIKNILNLSIPIGLGAIVMNLSGVIDSLLIQKRLFDIISFTPEILISKYPNLIPLEIIERNTVHVFLWGCFSTMTNFTMLVSSVTQGISISALPSVTASWISKDILKLKNDIKSIFKITALISIPCGLGLSALSYPILNLIYGNKSETYISSKFMIISGIAAIFSAMCIPLFSMLQAVGRADIPVKLITIGVLIKIILNYTLVGIPDINIEGANIGTFVCYLLIFVLAIYYLLKETKVNINIKNILLKLGFSGICCSTFAYISQELLSKFISNKISTVLAICIAVFTYLLALFSTKAVSSEDFKNLPKIYNLLKKFKIK